MDWCLAMNGLILGRQYLKQKQKQKCLFHIIPSRVFFVMKSAKGIINTFFEFENCVAFYDVTEIVRKHASHRYRRLYWKMYI